MASIRSSVSFVVSVLVALVLVASASVSAAVPETVATSTKKCTKMAFLTDEITHVQIPEWTVQVLMTPLPEATSELAELEPQMVRSAKRLLKLSKLKKNKRLIRSYIRTLNGLKLMSDEEKRDRAIAITDQMQAPFTKVSYNVIRGKC